MRANKSKDDESRLALAEQGNSSLVVSSPSEPPQTLVPALTIGEAKNIATRLKFIIEKTSVQLGKKRYVTVEGWKALAAEDGCCPAIEEIEWIEAAGQRPGGVRARAVLKRISDGAIITSAYGFCGDDEPTWKGRHQYAKEGMSQTRALARACRHRYDYIIILVGENYSTTPFEEMPVGGEQEGERRTERQKEAANVHEPSSQKIEGLVSQAGDKPATSKDGKPTGETLFFAKIGGKGVWSKDPQTGQELLDANGLEIEAYVVNSGKSLRLVEVRIPDKPTRSEGLELEPDDLDWGEKKTQPPTGSEPDPF